MYWVYYIYPSIKFTGGKIAKQQEAENIPLPEDDTDEDLDEEPAMYTQENIDVCCCLTFVVV